MLEYALNANSVAAFAQGLLSATMAMMLAAGARTPARKTLARAQMWLAAYAFAIADFGIARLDSIEALPATADANAPTARAAALTKTGIRAAPGRRRDSSPAHLARASKNRSARLDEPRIAFG